MANKITYGFLHKKYIENMILSPTLYKIVDDEYSPYDDGKIGYSMNLLSTKIQWCVEGKRLSKCLPRKKKKRLERLFNKRYNKLLNLIENMEE